MAETKDKKKPEQKSLSADDVKSLAGALQPKTFEEAIRLADILAKSDMVSREYREKPGDIIVAMATGANLGLHWSVALTSITVMDGKPTLYGDVGLALVTQSGKLEWIKEWDDPALDGGTAFCEAKRTDWPEPVKRSYSMAQAAKVKIYYWKDKPGGGREKLFFPLTSKPTWESYAPRMRQFRARWLCLRDVFADVLKGIVGREEYEDHIVIPDNPPQPAVAALPMPKAVDEQSPPQIATADQPKEIPANEKAPINGQEGKPDTEPPLGAESAFLPSDLFPR